MKQNLKHLLRLKNECLLSLEKLHFMISFWSLAKIPKTKQLECWANDKLEFGFSEKH